MEDDLKKTVIIELSCEPCRGIKLCYTLYSQEKTRRYYSLFIEESGIYGNDCIFLEDITGNKSKAIGLAKLFCKESVTPCSAEYIINELLPI